MRFKGAMRINVWRILIVYRYGGLYTDVDMYPTDKFNESGPIEVDDEAFFLSDGKRERTCIEFCETTISA